MKGSLSVFVSIDLNSKKDAVAFAMSLSWLRQHERDVRRS